MQALLCWDFIGEHPTEFDFGLDEDARNSGRRAALIRYSGAKPTRYREIKRVFGTLAQTVAAFPYHGQRIQNLKRTWPRKRSLMARRSGCV